MAPKPDRTLLIVSTDIYGCHFTARFFDLEPQRLCNFRNVTKADQLRGVSPGTPFIAANRDQWGGTAEGRALDLMLSHLEMNFRVRVMRPDEIQNYQEWAMS